MQIVIDIPDDDYEFVKEQVDTEYCNDVRQINNRLYQIIANGTALKQGCWVGIDEEPHEDWECNNCGFVIWADENIEKFHYCPNCGRRMIEPQESEEKQEQTRDEKMIDAIGFAIKATDSQDDYSMGMRNGMRYVKSLIDGKEPQYEFRRTDEEIKLGIDLGDEVVGDYGAKGVVVGIDTHKEAGVMLSLLMGNHKVPQLVHASNYKTKTGRHFPQIREVLEQMKGDTDGKDNN